MKQRREFEATVDAQGRLVLPPELVARMGLEAGTTLHLDELEQSWQIRRPINSLAKVYIEPTSLCNLACRTCIRNAWDEPLGQMEPATFARVVAGLREIPRPLTVFFGGFGEPLSHPEIVSMVAQVKALGAAAELITNGTLLDDSMARQLIAARLDTLWVSLDGATPESYTDVRLGAVLPDVIANVRRFSAARPGAALPAPELGIVFVAMRRNLGDLPRLLGLARELGASRFMVTNVLPHTPEMRDEALYLRAINNDTGIPSPAQPRLHMPLFDACSAVDPALYAAIGGEWSLEFAGTLRAPLRDRCPFVEAGALAVGWDGAVSPCLALLHSNHSYLNGIDRDVRRYVVGSVTSHDLRDLWREPEYVAFRARVQAFDFSPCTICDGCSLSETNETDCYGNTFPTCGGCLWAQGIVQCP